MPNRSQIKKTLLSGGAVPPIFNVTSFTQSLGSEKLANNSLTAWGGANDLTSWTEAGQVVPDPEITQVDTTELHGAAGTGSANLFSSATNGSPTLTQTSMQSVGDWIEVVALCSAITYGGGNVGRINLDTGSAAHQLLTFTSAIEQSTIIQARGTAFRVVPATAPIDATFDQFSDKGITLNALQTGAVNGALGVRFTLPGSPVVGQRVTLQYRVVDASNYWQLYLIWRGSQWDLLLDSVTALAPTNQINATDVGAADAIAVVLNGDDHTIYSGVGAALSSMVWTQEGTENNSAHNTAVQSRTISHSAITPLEMMQIASTGTPPDF